MHKASSKGFTLIELLVVIAIIGLLSSIVLASLGTARNKGRDANIQQNLQSMRNQLELIRDTSRACYPGPSTVCSAAQTSSNLTTQCGPVGNQNLVCSYSSVYNSLVSATQASGGVFFGVQVSQGATAYAISVRLATDKALAWCVDSSGNSKPEGTAGSPTALTAATIALLMTGGVCN